VYIATVLSPTLLLFAQAGLVAVVPDGNAGCPSSKEIEEALYARVPGVVVPFAEAKRRGALRLTLTPATVDGRRTFSLIDVDGRTRLQRSLGASVGQKDCIALAETASLIVQRFLTSLVDPVPKPVQPDPVADLSARTPEGPDRRWDLSVSSGWRVGTEVWGALTVGARVGRLLGTSGRFLAVAGVGVGGSGELAPSGTNFQGRAVQWRGELQAGVGGGLDLTRVHASAESGSADTRLLPGPMIFLAGAFRLPLRARTFVRLSGMLAGSLVTYRFTYRPQSTEDGLTIFSVPTRRIYGRIAAEIGFTLR
jgi:hypothetical protein